jgi:hypothetical protein
MTDPAGLPGSGSPRARRLGQPSSVHALTAELERHVHELVSSLVDILESRDWSGSLEEAETVARAARTVVELASAVALGVKLAERALGISAELLRATASQPSGLPLP